jgi:hypothetical protein
VKAPFVLRAQVAWTVLTGRVLSISVATGRFETPQYRLELEPRSVERWRQRNLRRAVAREKRAAYEKSKEVV